MDFDDQMRRYFATADIAEIAPGALVAGIEQMQVDFGMEADRGRRFALWTLMYLLGAAPDLDVAFEDRRTATPRAISWILWRAPQRTSGPRGGKTRALILNPRWWS